MRQLFSGIGQQTPVIRERRETKLNHMVTTTLPGDGFPTIAQHAEVQAESSGPTKLSSEFKAAEIFKTVHQRRQSSEESGQKSAGVESLPMNTWVKLGCTWTR